MRDPASAFGIVVALLALGMAACVAQVPAPPGTSQSVQPASPAAFAPPRTPWGEPDLQGLWSAAVATPLERPSALGTKQFYTEEEARARDARLLASATDEARGKDARSDLAGAYNDFWWDSGTKGARTRRTGLITSTADGRIPWRPDVAARHAEILKQRAAMLESPTPIRSWLDVNTGERCITDGIPWVPYAYNNNYLITQSPGVVAVLHEQFREVRVFAIGEPRGAGIPQWFGNSSARWEGQTLVVETKDFADKSTFWWDYPWRQAHPTYTLTERFTRSGADELMYEFTVTNPALFTEPWSSELPMPRADGQIYEYACHEGNYSMASMIGTGRSR